MLKFNISGLRLVTLTIWMSLGWYLNESIENGISFKSFCNNFSRKFSYPKPTTWTLYTPGRSKRQYSPRLVVRTGLVSNPSTRISISLSGYPLWSVTMPLMPWWTCFMYSIKLRLFFAHSAGNSEAGGNLQHDNSNVRSVRRRKTHLNQSKFYLYWWFHNIPKQFELT